jgi:hypothetical protein
MKQPTHPVFAFIGGGNYKGHAIRVWWADGTWHYRAAVVASWPLPGPFGRGHFGTARQATDAAMAFVDGLHRYR